MSDNEPTESNALQVEGILDINENKSGVLLDPARGGKTTPNDPLLARLTNCRLSEIMVLISCLMSAESQPPQSQSPLHSYR